jgi:hypothetical protein
MSSSMVSNATTKVVFDVTNAPLREFEIFKNLKLNFGSSKKEANGEEDTHLGFRG